MRGPIRHAQAVSQHDIHRCSFCAPSIPKPIPRQPSQKASRHCCLYALPGGTKGFGSTQWMQQGCTPYPSAHRQRSSGLSGDVHFPPRTRLLLLHGCLSPRNLVHVLAIDWQRTQALSETDKKYTKVSRNERKKLKRTAKRRI